MKILLLSCCAPCSCAVIEKLSRENADFAVLFYNPNIRPYEEYLKRLEENKRLCEQFNVKFIDLEYDNNRWCELTKGLENEPERGARCSVCFKMRLQKAMEYALENGFDVVASVLAASRWKDLNQVNRAAQEASQITKVPYIQIEARKQGMQERRHQLIKDMKLYEQQYCGCKPKI
ncbi:MAG: epoxyqueuosine reductase QueH [Alphaproteobacteria bacterium]|nr:epoxyqueuosine reductase QueH [Alphaproteobacteria bacterium]